MRVPGRVCNRSGSGYIVTLAAHVFAAIYSSDHEYFLIHGDADRIGNRAIRKGGLFK